MSIPVAIPLAPFPFQVVSVQLGSQPCRLEIFQKATGLFINVYVSDVAIVLGAACLNAVFIVRDIYRGFLGDLVFADTQGNSDPDYTGLGGRFSLLWVAPS